jgi:glycosyltransferase involved in cell wall biosynthesis
VYGIFVKRQIESLQSLGLSCDVLFIEGYRTRWEYARAAVHMLGLNRSKGRPLLVHSHGGETSIAVRWFVRGQVVISYCGDDLLGTPHADGSLILSSRVRRFVFRQLSLLMSGTVTKSAEMEATLPRRARARNIVVPNGVDRTLFRPRLRDEARHKLGWPNAQRIVLFAANPAVERKRYWLAQSACREAQREIGALQLVAAHGTPPDEMPLRMAAADCLLLTSSIEGSPNVVKEAVACGLLDQVEPSWVCAPHPEELAAALVECLTEPRRSDGWERSAWLGQDQIALRLLGFYRKLVPELAGQLHSDRLPLLSHAPSAVGAHRPVH